jgi:hypothetical protein
MRLTIADAPAIHTKTCRATSLSRDEHFHFPASSRRATSFGSAHTGPRKVIAVTFFCCAMTLRKVGFFQLFDATIARLDE